MHPFFDLAFTMKKIFLIFLSLILLGFVFHKSKILLYINTLKKAGFYQKLENQSVFSIAKYAYSKQSYSGILYSVLFSPSRHELVILDSTKYTDIYPEVLAYEGANFYANLVHRFSLLSDGKFNPIQIKEDWKTKEGPLDLTYVSNGELVVLNPNIKKDWLDQDIVHHLKLELEKAGVRLKKLNQSDGALIRIKPKEQKILEEKFDWSFE